MVYFLMLGLNYVYFGSISILDFFSCIFCALLMFLFFGWINEDPSLVLLAPLVTIGKYVVFATMAIALAIIMIFQLFPITHIQYIAFLVTVPIVYHLVDTAFEFPE